MLLNSKFWKYETLANWRIQTPVKNFNVANMIFSVIRKNKILAIFFKAQYFPGRE